MNSFLLNLLDLLFPPVCAACGTRLDEAHAGKMLCSACMAEIRYVTSPKCHICGLPFASSAGADHVCGECIEKSPSFDRARAVFVYSGPVRKLIHRIKYQGDGYALKALCSICRRALNADHYAGDVLFVPVPLHVARLRDRGFNQAISIARRLFPMKKMPVHMLERTRDTLPQMKLSASQRHANTRGAFRVRDSELEALARGDRVVLFDDILTTGSTVESAARELKRAGARRVDVLTVARAVRH